MSYCIQQGQGQKQASQSYFPWQTWMETGIFNHFCLILIVITVLITNGVGIAMLQYTYLNKQHVCYILKIVLHTCNTENSVAYHARYEVGIVHVVLTFT